MKTLKKFLDENNIKMASCRPVAKRPDNLMSDMPYGSKHWEIVIECRQDGVVKSFQVYFSRGPTHKDSPKILDVMSCLISDAQAGEYDPFDFMTEFGYQNANEARKIYNACVETRQKMLDFLGEELLNEAIYEVESY